MVDFLGLNSMPSGVSLTSSRVPSWMLYFLRSCAGIVVCPFLVTTTSSVSTLVTVVQVVSSTYKPSYQEGRLVRGLCENWGFKEMFLKPKMPNMVGG